RRRAAQALLIHFDSAGPSRYCREPTTSSDANHAPPAAHTAPRRNSSTAQRTGAGPGRNDAAWTTNTHRTSTAPMASIGRNVYLQAHPRGIGHHRHFGVELHASSGKPVIMRAAPWDRRIEIHRKVRATTEASSTDVCIATTIPTAGAARN